MRSLARDAAELAPSLTFSIAPQRLPTLLAHPERWTELVDAEGDAALAATIADLARTLPWFVEQAFASALGPIIGTRVADAGRALLALPEQAARSFGASLSSYVRDEAELGVDATRLADFSAEVAAISARVDALALLTGDHKLVHKLISVIMHPMLQVKMLLWLPIVELLIVFHLQMNSIGLLQTKLHKHYHNKAFQLLKI